jgi:Family of unknown function (DUF6364)
MVFYTYGGFMETKLTLKLDAAVIRRAKKYVRKKKGGSLSKTVEKYFNSLTRDDGSHDKRISPIVAGLAGAARQKAPKNIKEEYVDYLIEKYS